MDSRRVTQKKLDVVFIVAYKIGVKQIQKKAIDQFYQSKLLYLQNNLILNALQYPKNLAYI